MHLDKYKCMKHIYTKVGVIKSMVQLDLTLNEGQTAISRSNLARVDIQHHNPLNMCLYTTNVYVVTHETSVYAETNSAIRFHLEYPLKVKLSFSRSYLPYTVEDFNMEG